MFVLRLVLALLATAVKCELSITDVTGDAEIPITSTYIEKVQGANFSLSCSLDGSAASSKGQVVWLRFKDKIGQSNRISFNPLRMDHQGTYTCQSSTRNISTSIELHVKASEHKRVKRLNLLHFGRPNTNTDEQHDAPHKEPHAGSKGWIYGGVVLAVIATIILVMILVYCFMKNLNIQAIISENKPEARPACNHPNCGQYCTFVRRDDEIPSTSCSPKTVPRQMSSSIATISKSADDAETKSAAGLPPTYVISSYCDRKYNLPPTYNQVLQGNRTSSA